MQRVITLGALALLLLPACAEQHQKAADDGTRKLNAIARTCPDASLSLEPEAVVATLDGKAIRMKDLGEELAAQEEKHLREYCSAVSETRKQALDAHVNDLLIRQEAEKAGKEPDAWVRDRLMALTPMPDEASMRRFYEERAGPGAPPFEEIQGQVVEAMRQDAMRRGIGSLIGELREGVKVEDQFPDVRPAAMGITVPASAPVLGASGAPVTVVAFSDFQCPYCARAADAVHALHDKYGEKVRVVFRHFPLSFHENARRTAEYGQCLHRQDKFWAFHDQVFENQGALSETDLKGYANAVGADASQLEACLADETIAKQVQADLDDGKSYGVGGTPTFFINGRQFEGMPTAEGLGEAIDKALAKSDG